MAIFNKITEQEKEAFKTLVNWYGARNEDRSMSASLEHVLRFWEYAKEDYLFTMMGDNLILEKEIEYNRDSAEIADEIRKEINYSSFEFIREWERFCSDIMRDTDYSPIGWNLRDLASSNSLASNRWTRSNFTVPLPDNKEYVVSNGCKVSKAIGKIANAYHLKGYEEFRIAHSQTLNEKTIKGILCLSIHPLDFATMSDNDCGWSSCMSWNEHGDFRQGTVEMMNSPCVVEAYLKSSTDYILDCGFNKNKLAWSSKRWRELFIVTPQAIMGIKGYPYWNRNLEVAVMDWIKELVETNLPSFGKYEDKIANYMSNEKAVYFTDDSEAIPFETHTCIMYNDCYDEHQCYINVNHPDSINLEYSGESECLCCGEKLYDYDTESDLFCNNCDTSFRCDECGDYISGDNYYEVDGRYYCSYCYEEYIESCEECGREHYVNDMTEVYFALDSKHIDMNNRVWICSDCIDSGKYFNASDIICGKHGWNHMEYITLDKLTDCGKEMFRYNVEDDIYEKRFTSFVEDDYIVEKEKSQIESYSFPADDSTIVTINY